MQLLDVRSDSIEIARGKDDAVVVEMTPKRERTLRYPDPMSRPEHDHFVRELTPKVHAWLAQHAACAERTLSGTSEQQTQQVEVEPKKE